MNHIQLFNQENLRSTNSIKKPGYYVGVELDGYYFDDDNLNQQFFNGASLNNCLFQSKEIRHTEIREALLQKCQFINCNLTSSDLVYSKFINCIFINCQFGNGEWIESEFLSCQFLNSIFSHTTINLTLFNSCQFDKNSFSGLNDQSVQFNIFNECKFDSNADLINVVDKNFGINGSTSTDYLDTSGDLFVKMSRLLFLNCLPTHEFINISSKIVEQLLHDSNRSYLLRSKYLSYICRSYIDSQKVSPFGIQRLEKSISKKIQQSNSNNEGLFSELVQLIMTIRLTYGNRIAAIEERMSLLNDIENIVVISSKLYFKKHYSENQVRYLQEYIAEYCEINKQTIKYHINHNSTEIISELITNVPMYLTLFYGAFLSILKAVELTTKTAKNITGDIVVVIENINKISTLKSENIKNNKTEVNIKQDNRKALQTQKNTINTLNGKYEGKQAKKTALLACNEKIDAALEMEDYAKLEITVSVSNIIKETK